MLRQAIKAFKQAPSVKNYSLLGSYHNANTLANPLYTQPTKYNFCTFGVGANPISPALDHESEVRDEVSGQTYTQQPYKAPTAQPFNIQPPRSMPRGLTGLFFDTVQKIPHFGPKSVAILREFISLSSKSMHSDEAYNTLKERISSLSLEQMDILVRLLYIHQHVMQIEEASLVQFKRQRQEMPVRQTISNILEDIGRSDTFKILPTWLCEVFTAHPVFADKESVVSRKEILSANYKEWLRKAEIISHLPANTPSYRGIRIDMNSFYDRMMENMSTMLQIDPVREVKISSVQEQDNLRRRLSKLIDDCLLTGEFVRDMIKERMLEDIAEEYLNSENYDENLNEILQEPRSHNRTSKLMNNELIKKNPDYQRAIDKDFYFTLNVWGFDLDGNPNVNQTTLVKSIAMGMKILLLSEHFIERMEEVLPVTIREEDSDILEEIQNRIDEAEPYLSWTLEGIKDPNPVRKLCLLARKRLLLTMQKIEDVLAREDPGIYELLNQKGFVNQDEFLEFIKPLVEVEKRYNIDKIWTHRARTAKVFTLSTAECHFRVAESSNQKAISEYMHVIDPERFPQSVTLLNMERPQQIEVFKEIIENKRRAKNIELAKVSKGASETLRNWKAFSVLQNKSLIVQSDSTDPLYSINLLKSLGTLFNFQGKYSPLFESKETMENALTHLRRETGPLFDQVRVMSAGSDNQKKMGVFLSCYYNIKFMTLAQRKGLVSFLGKGCSPFRSKRLQGLTDMETCQPGRQRDFMENPKEYLLNRFVTRMTNKKKIYKMTDEEIDRMERIAGLICEKAFNGRKKHLEKIAPNLNSTFSEYLEKSLSTAYSRPDKKAVASGDLLTSIRAIVASKIKLYTSMQLDTDVGDVKQEIIDAIKMLKEEGITEDEVHKVFSSLPYCAIPDTLRDFYQAFDEKIAQEQTKGYLPPSDVKDVFKLLTGNDLKDEPKDPYLRLVRLICLEHKRNPELKYIPEFLFVRYPV